MADKISDLGEHVGVVEFVGCHAHGGKLGVFLVLRVLNREPFERGGGLAVSGFRFAIGGVGVSNPAQLFCQRNQFGRFVGFHGVKAAQPDTPPP